VKLNLVKGGCLLRVENFGTQFYPSDLKFCYCGYEDCEKDFFCGPYIRNNYLIHLITKGEGYYLLNGKTYHLKKGDFFVIFPNDISVYKTVKENPWSFYWFAFDGTMAEYNLNIVGIDRLSPVEHIENHQELEKKIQNLINISSSFSLENMLFVSAYLRECIGLIQKSLCHKIQNHKPNQKEQEIKLAIQYIEFNYYKNISSCIIANELGFERTYFCKIFKQVTGLSPQQYIIKYRLNQAAKLLMTTSIASNDIAEMVGFQNINYFFRKFKSEMNCTPNEYRKNSK
jgi:AraC family transcriptional regulator of arabinose operon